MSQASSSSLLNLTSMSLRRRFAVLLGGIAVITFILAFAFSQYMLRATEQEFEQRSLLLAEALGAESMLNLLMQDTAGLQESLQRVVDREMAAAAAFYAPDGSRLAGQQVDELLAPDFATVEGPMLNWTATTNDLPVLVAARPVERTGELGGDTDEPAGYVLVAVPSDEIQAQQRTANLMTLLLLVVIAGIAWYVHRKLRHTVTEPVDRLRTAAEAVEHGDLSTRVEVEQQDEIGQLARSFNAMVAASEDNMKALEEQGEQARAAQDAAERLQQEADEERTYLQHQFERISTVIRAATDGDLTQRLRVDRDDAVGTLMGQLNDMLDDLENLIREVQTAGRSLAEAAHVAASSAEEMSAGAQEQAQQTGEVAASIEEMSATIATSSRHAHDSNQMAQRASSLAASGEKVFSETTEGMGRIAGLVRASAEKVEALGTSSGQIGEIVETIEDIADQTNLLALNAAIEAARAGEQGRGFAVVADEVRKLAERTTGATDEIARMIREIQHNTQEVVASMSRGTDEVENGLHLSEEASQSLGEIVASIQGMVQMIEQITVASEQQAGASTQIAQNVDAIASVASEVSHSTSELARMADDMNGQSDVLQQLIARFHIRDRHAPSTGGDGAARASITMTAG